MEMFFIILFVNREAIVLPEKYPYDQCDKVGKEWGSRYRCLAAPKFTIDLSKSCNDPSGVCPLPQGYFCGQYPTLCKIEGPKYIDNMPKCFVNPNSGKLECN